jgi:hypothetical protein
MLSRGTPAFSSKRRPKRQLAASSSTNATRTCMLAAAGDEGAPTKACPGPAGAATASDSTGARAAMDSAHVAWVGTSAVKCPAHSSESYRMKTQAKGKAVNRGRERNHRQVRACTSRRRVHTYPMQRRCLRQEEIPMPLRGRPRIGHWMGSLQQLLPRSLSRQRAGRQRRKRLWQPGLTQRGQPGQPGRPGQLAPPEHTSTLWRLPSRCPAHQTSQRRCRPGPTSRCQHAPRRATAGGPKIHRRTRFRGNTAIRIARLGFRKNAQIEPFHRSQLCFEKNRATQQGLVWQPRRAARRTVAGGS